MATYIAYYALFACFIGNVAEQLNGCEQISGLYKASNRLRLHDVTDEDLLKLPSCLQNTSRVFIISVQESNFTLAGLVNALSERIRQYVVDLEINNCQLTEIPSEVLSNLPRLRYINLGSNVISILDTNSFSNMDELQTINLSNNRLTTIQTATFSNLPSLIEISLQNNLLSEIAKNAFQNVPSLVVIYLDHNRLQKLPYRAFRPSNIKFMHATNNGIRDISSNIRRFGELVNLDVRNNSLTHVSKDVAMLRNLKELHMSWNNLTTLPEEMALFIENSSLNIALGNNPWTCDCSLLWLISWVSRGNTREDIFCETPQFINMSRFNANELDCTDRIIKDAHAVESDASFSKPLDFFMPDVDGVSSVVNYEPGPSEYIDSDGFSANEFIVCLDKPYKYSPDVVLEDFIANQKCCIFSQLKDNCEQVLKTWNNFMYMTNSSNVKYVELYDSDEHWETPRVKACVSVNKDLTLNVMVHGKPLPENHNIYEKVGRSCYSVRCIQNVFDIISEYHICEGNSDTELQDLIPVGSFMDIANGYKYQGYREAFYIQSTIRSTKCDFLVQKKDSRCRNCQTYRRTLRKVLNRRNSTPKVSTPKRDWTKCRTSNSNLTENQKLHKIKQLKDYTSKLELENARLRREISQKIRTEGVRLSEREGKDLSELMQSCEWDVKKSHPDESSYQRLFWEEQLKYSQLKDSRGMRWHPSIIKWCIYLKSKSTSTYDTLRNSGFIKLPSERTLFDYTNANAKGVGFLEGNIDMLIDETEAFPRSGYIILAIVLVFVAITTSVTIFYMRVWNNKSKSMKRPIKMIVNGHYYIPQSDEDSTEVTSSTVPAQNGSTDCETPQKQGIKKIQFDEKRMNGLLRLGKRLGRGAFGDVFEGHAAESNNGIWKKVAIKRIRDNAASYDSDNLITEYQQLTDIGKHPNIIQVFGIGKFDESLIMVMELAENGDMLAHLKDIERSNYRTIRNLDSSEERFYLENKHQRLFLYMWHVAKGMDYLSTMKVVHRDLAARNILLAAGNVAKLSDFGLSRDVYENGYYYQSSKGRLPYKWMSPETLSNGKFTFSSDVWSYGVLLWEIVTLGSSPYPGIPPDMLINMYKSKYIMPQPPLCPDSIYAVMKDCWKHIPEERTDFTSLVDRLDKLVQTFSKKQYMDVYFEQGGNQVSLSDEEVSQK